MQIVKCKSYILKLIVICILMHLVVFGATCAIAATYVMSDTNGNVTHSNNDYIEFSRGQTKDELYYMFKPTQTGLYAINAYATGSTNTPATYRLDRVVTRQISTIPSYVNVSLASQKKDGTVSLANPGNNAYNKKMDAGPNKSRVYVILDANSTYIVRFSDDYKNYIIQFKKATEEAGASYGFSQNFPSAWVTLGKKDTAINSNDPALDNYPRMDVSADTINQTVKDLGLEDVSGKDHSFWWLESILVYIIFAIGNLIVQIFESALGIKGLTLDGIIFNKLSNSVNNPTVDLRPLGGIGPSLGTDYDGILKSEAVVGTVGTIFNSLKTIALVFYVIILLYVGLRMLLAVGTKQEAKSKKFVQYWLTGLLLLTILPYFLPAIPFMSNQLVAQLSEKASSTSKYSLAEIAKELGNKYRGEDAEVIKMADDLNERIKKIQDQLSGQTVLNVDEAEEQLQSYIDNNITNNNKYTEEEKNAIINKINELKNYVKDHALTWTDNDENYLKTQTESEAKNRYNSLKSKWIQAETEGLDTLFIYTGGPPSDHPLSSISDSEKANIKNKLIDIYTYIINNQVPGTDNTFVQKKNAILDLIDATDSPYKSQAKNRISNNLSIDVNNYSTRVNLYKSNMYNALVKYKNALLGEKLQTYEDMLASLNDPMVTLYRMAKEQNRVVYAVAWAILMFQVIAILFMYYKRVFVILILVILFPIVMALYVIDKLGDGHAQSFENWFKEFFVNCFIQFLHAVVYVLVVNLGIEICNLDPQRNWFFLIIAVTSLFPIERMFRQIVGLNASTVGGLKNNIMGLVLAGAALSKTGGNLFNMGANAASQGIAFGKDIAAQHAGGKSFKEIGKDKLTEGKKKAMEAIKAPAKQVQDKRNRKTQLRQSRSDNRAYRQQAASDARTAIRSGVGTIGDRIDIARGAVANVTGAVSNTMNKVRNSKIGQVGAKLSLGASYAKAYGGKALKMSSGAYKKLGGAAAGFVTGMEAAADSAVANGEGFAAGITSGRKAIHEFGGFKDHSRNKPEEAAKNPPSNFANSYSPRSGHGGSGGGSGSGGPTVPGGPDPDSGTPDSSTSAVDDTLIVGTAAAIGAATMSGGSSDEEPTSSATVTEPAEEAAPSEDKHEEIEINYDMVRDEEGNVSGEANITGELEINEGETPNVNIGSEIETDDSGNVEIGTGAEIDMDGSGTVTSTTNNEGNMSKDTTNI